MEEHFLNKLRNILVCYSIRNSSIGYCQGMNFIVGRLLRIIDNEEQTFWLFAQIIEHILPINYYSELTGIIMDTTLADVIISAYLPDLYSYIKEQNFKLSLSNFIHKWFVCLFASTLSKEIVYTLFDFFFLDGSVCLMKSCLCLLANMQRKMMQSKDFEWMYGVINEEPQKIKATKVFVYFLYEKEE